MSPDEKQMSAPALTPPAGPAAAPQHVYPGRDELLATARSTASMQTPDPY